MLHKSCFKVPTFDSVIYAFRLFGLMRSRSETSCETCQIPGETASNRFHPGLIERIRGRHNIQASRTAQPKAKRLTVRGTGDLWITEFTFAYDGLTPWPVSVMEFLDGKVARETQYFGDPLDPGPSRAQRSDSMG
jgi:hypothetical protein